MLLLIIWHSVNFPNNRDIVLRYSKGDKTTFHKVFVAHDPTYVPRQWIRFHSLDYIDAMHASGWPATVHMLYTLADLVGDLKTAQAMGSLFHHGYVTARTDIPRRTDIDAPIPYRQNKHVLYGQQEGLCNGCGVMFPFRNFTVDHVVPQSRGGTDHFDNLQLLCGACNSVKGDRPQEHLIARLKEMAI